jgi:hypothetical protein
MATGTAPFSERLRLGRELENLVDGMPSKAVEVLVQYAARLKAAYEPQEPRNWTVTIYRVKDSL